MAQSYVKNETGLKGFSNVEGTQYTNIATGKTFDSYEAFIDDYAQEEQNRRDSFSNSMQNALDGLSTSIQGVGVFGSGITYSPTAGMVTYNTPQDFQRFSANTDIIKSGINALTHNLTQNTNLFGLTSADMNKNLEDYMQANGYAKSEGLVVPEEFKNEIIEKAKLQQNNPAWDTFVQEHQALAQWLSNPANYARMNDDVKNQTGISKMIQEGAYASFKSSLETERGRMYWKMANGDELTDAEKDRIKILNEVIKKFSREDKSGEHGILGTVGSLLGGFTPTLGEGLKGAGVGAGAGAVVGAGAASAPLAVLGAGYGAVIAMAHREAQTSAGNLYGDIYEKTKDKPTVKATAYGALVGASNAFTIGQAGVVTQMAHETGVLKALGKQAVKDTIISGLLGGADYATQEGIRQTYGIGQDATIGDAIWNTAKAGGVNALFSLAISSPGYLWVGLHQLGKRVDATHTQQRNDIDTQAQVIDTVAKNTDFSTVNINAEAIKNYMEGTDITDKDNADFIRLVKNPSAFNEALQTGVPIKVTLGEFVTTNPKMRNALLPDVSNDKQLSLRDYQGYYDMVMSMQGGEGVTSLYEPKFQVYNMLQDSGNQDILNIIKETEQAIKDSNNAVPTREIDSEVASRIKDVNTALEENPMYSLAQDITDNKDLSFRFDLQRFSNKTTGEVDLRAWAKAHLNGFDDPNAQAMIDNLAVSRGYSSGAEFINQLSKAPTKSEIYSAVREQVAKSFKVDYANGAELALDLQMQKAFGTNKLLYDFIEGKDLDKFVADTVKKTDEKYNRQIEQLKAQADNVDNTVLVSENSKSIKDARVQLLLKQIDDLKDEQKAKIKEVKVFARERANERLQKQKDKYNERIQRQKERSNERLEKQKERDAERLEKQKERTQGWKEKYTGLVETQKEYARQLRLDKKTARQGMLTVEKAKELARKNLSNAPISDILDKNRYVLAVRKANAQANRAYETGDYYEAIRQTNKVITSLAHLQECFRLQKTVAKLDRQATSFSRKKKDFWGTEETKAQVDRILYIMGVNKKSPFNTNGVTLPEFLEVQANNTGRVANVPDSIKSIFSLGNNNPYPTRDMTIYQYKDTLDLLSNLRTIGKEAGTMFQRNLDVKANEVKQKMINTLADYTPAKTGKSYDPTISRADRSGLINIRGFVNSLYNIDTWCTKFEGREGVFRDFFINLKSERATLKSKLSSKIFTQLESLDKAYTKKERVKRATKNIYIDELGVTVSKDDLLGLAMNTGCLDNWNKMFSVNKKVNEFGSVETTFNTPLAFAKASDWTPDTVLSVLGKYLTEKDWSFVEGHWKLFDDLWNGKGVLSDFTGGAKGFEKARTGFTPVEAERHPFEVPLPDGGKRKLSGGFYPLSKDPNSRFITGSETRDANGQLQADLGQINQNYGASTMTKKGHYVSRTGAKYILSTDFKTNLVKYFDNVTTDIAFRDWAVMANDILKDPAMQRELLIRHGDGAVDMFAKNILDTVGSNYGNLLPDATQMTLQYFKRASSSALIGLNPTTALQSLTNPLLAIQSVKGWGAKETIRALIKHGIGNGMFPSSKAFKKMMEENYAMSPLLRDMIGGNPDFALYRNYGTINTNLILRLQDNLWDITSRALAYSDALTIHPIFRGIVEQGLSKGLTQEQAVRRAETAIKRIIPSDKKYEQSNFINAPAGSMYNFVNGLASYSNVLFNNVARFYSLSTNNIKELPNFMVYMTSAVILGALMSDIVSFRSPLSSDKEEDKTPVGWLKWGVNSGVGAVAGMVPFFGEPLRAFSAVMTDNPYYGTRTPSGIGTAVNQATTFTLKVKNDKATSQDVAEATAKMASFFTGVPQYFINVFFNGVELFTDPQRTIEIRDAFRRRPINER